MTLLDLTELLPDSLRRARRDSLYALAERYAARAVASDSMGADGHFALAAAIGTGSVLLGKEARIRRAGIIRREALKAIALNPRHDGAYHILGRWNAEIMRLSGLSRFFARNFLGAGVFKQASWKKAIAFMEKAVELDPGRIQHHLELARIYCRPEALGGCRGAAASGGVAPCPRDHGYHSEAAGSRAAPEAREAITLVQRLLSPCARPGKLGTNAALPPAKLLPRGVARPVDAIASIVSERTHPPLESAPDLVTAFGGQQQGEARAQKRAEQDTCNEPGSSVRRYGGTVVLAGRRDGHIITFHGLSLHLFLPAIVGEGAAVSNGLRCTTYGGRRRTWLRT